MKFIIPWEFLDLKIYSRPKQVCNNQKLNKHNI